MAVVQRQRPRVSPSPHRRGPVRKRHLVLIRGGRSTERRGSSGRRKPAARRKVARTPTARFAAAASVVVMGFVFGLVMLHILLAQASFRLEALHRRVADEEARHRRMRHEIAVAESPARIAEAAAGLGLIEPQERRYVVVPFDEAPLGPELAEEQGSDRLKAVLGKQP